MVERAAILIALLLLFVSALLFVLDAERSSTPTQGDPTHAHD